MEPILQVALFSREMSLKPRFDGIFVQFCWVWAKNNCQPVLGRPPTTLENMRPLKFLPMVQGDEFRTWRNSIIFRWAAVKLWGGGCCKKVTAIFFLAQRRNAEISSEKVGACSSFNWPRHELHLLVSLSAMLQGADGVFLVGTADTEIQIPKVRTSQHFSQHYSEIRKLGRKNATYIPLIVLAEPGGPHMLPTYHLLGEPFQQPLRKFQSESVSYMLEVTYSGQIIATKPPVGHPKWWWKVQESPQNTLNSGLGIIGSFAQTYQVSHEKNPALLSMSHTG